MSRNGSNTLSHVLPYTFVVLLPFLDMLGRLAANVVGESEGACQDGGRRERPRVEFMGEHDLPEEEEHRHHHDQQWRAGT